MTSKWFGTHDTDDPVPSSPVSASNTLPKSLDDPPSNDDDSYWGLSSTSTKVIYYHMQGGSRIPCRRGRRPSRGAPTYDFVKFSEKLHEIEKILGHRGVRAGCAPQIRPTDMEYISVWNYLFLLVQKDASLSDITVYKTSWCHSSVIKL